MERRTFFDRRRSFTTSAAVAVFLAICVPAIAPQSVSQSEPKPENSSKAPSEDGFPVNDQRVISKCSSCHLRDAKGNMTRISWIRTTPEGWEEAIKRMVRLQGVSLEPDDARTILRYLSDEHGLAPEEAKPVEYFPEHRMVDEKVPNEDVTRSCVACHALAKPLSWRRSAEDWRLLVNTHIALYPWVDGLNFQRQPPRPGQPPPAPDAKQPVDQALAFLAQSGSLHSPEWAEWRASMRAPRLTGHWLVAGAQPGKGKFFGVMDIESVPSTDGFSTKTKLTFPGNGSVLTENGKSLVYTGYAWRGRSTSEKVNAGPNDPTVVREVMMLSRDQSQLEGRWFWGAYQEFGMDTTMRRASAALTVLGVDVYSLKTGSSGNEVKIYGDHFPTAISAADIDLGSGVTVKKVVSQTPELIKISVDVTSGAVLGKRDVVVKNSLAPAAFAVYDKIDYLQVTPQTPLAHLGGEPHAKGYMQFDAIAYSNGPDGKQGTADDLELGPVKASWKLEEFVATMGDDDVEFVGNLDATTGLFTPALDGPNPKRKFGRNNYGDVWVVATYKPSGAEQVVSGRSYLVVAIPQYMRWDQPEVTQ
ncbi:MAG TPA: quinohemoprotein amine dehydrogenase subunit alpha [Candidatus Eisenbacteria bacterium]|jgi:quinohemoprotein amine dehydrogenase|nr:quinohemoprotein amine dehydrogenase subunit alpha [Candidatus Eisenbacteria bacterium]